jgi:hypothetical protein
MSCRTGSCPHSRISEKTDTMIIREFFAAVKDTVGYDMCYAAEIIEVT